MKRLWSIPLEGTRSASDLFIDRQGRIVVSTVRHAEEREPRGLAHVTTHEWSASSSASISTRFINSFAHRCYAIDPRGKVVWKADAVAKAIDPHGRIVATNDEHALMMFDEDGRLLDQTPTHGEPWAVLGWQGEAPVLSPVIGAAWIDSEVFFIADHQLHRAKPDGTVIAKTRISRAPFDIAFEQQQGFAYPDALLFPPSFDLVFDAARDRLLATSWSMLAWVMGLRRDGTIDWVTLAGDTCCNSACFAGDVLVHASSCGSMLSFVGVDGRITSRQKIDELADVRGAGDTALVRSLQGMQAIDAHGEMRWSLAQPDIHAALLHDEVLYVAAGPDNALALTAYAI